MMTRVKFADAAAEEGYTEIFRKSLNLKGRGSVLEERTGTQMEASELDWRALKPWAQALPADAMPAKGLTAMGSAVVGYGSRPLVEQDALTEMLEEMSLSTLLYYVLAGEGMDSDEPS